MGQHETPPHLGSSPDRGAVTPADVAQGGRLLVISPHLDDAILGCGQLLAAHPGSIVVTVFAGYPATYERLTSWDEAAGFCAGQDVVGARRAEDRAALSVVGAQPVWLDFLDGQYGPLPDADAVAGELEQTLARVGTPVVLIPMGLFHRDHVLTHEAALRLLHREPNVSWFAYEEPIYRQVPGLLQNRMVELHAAGIITQSTSYSVSRQGRIKRRAIAKYPSQLRALAAWSETGYADAYDAERYWSLRLATSAPHQERRP